MRNPFSRPKTEEEKIRKFLERATFVPTHEMAWPQLSRLYTYEELRAAGARSRARRRANGDLPS
jgi:hypothetical protein